MTKNIPNCVAMVRPKNFAFNTETAESNAFQNKLEGFTANQIQDLALLEFNNMVNLLKSNGIKVLVFNDTASDTPDSIFPNNWFSTFTDEVILYPMYSENRRRERKPQIYKKLSNDLRKTLNDKLLKQEKKGVILEGTGSLVCDYESKTAFAALSTRTTPEALDKFEELTGYSTVRFESFGPDDTLIYHTNVMMTMADSYVILAVDTIKEDHKNQVLDTLKKLNKEVIAISNDQAFKHFAGNMLQLQNTKGQKFLVMSKEALDSLTSEQKDIIENKHNNKIIAAPIHTIEKIGGGSARCMMAEIFYN
ncbi:MAG: hypothetical protein KJP21_03040 [Bacteroidia bacterium]|nr:hypothetical protein [Bacteroidia bacterium]NNJ55494.1 hypothetical protein [Bacteroidia bacterium]